MQTSDVPKLPEGVDLSGNQKINSGKSGVLTNLGAGLNSRVLLTLLAVSSVLPGCFVGVGKKSEVTKADTVVVGEAESGKEKVNQTCGSIVQIASEDLSQARVRLSCGEMDVTVGDLDKLPRDNSANYFLIMPDGEIKPGTEAVSGSAFNNNTYLNENGIAATLELYVYEFGGYVKLAMVAVCNGKFPNVGVEVAE